MKKNILIAMVLVLSILLCACGGAGQAAPTETMAPTDDELFLARVAQGLEARWHLSDTTDIPANDADYPAYATELINAELDAIGSLSEYDFQDPALKELAWKYYNALCSQVEGAAYYVNIEDYLKYEEVFIMEGYNQRAKVIGKLYSEYGLTVSEEYADSMNNFVTLYQKFSAIDMLAQQELVLNNLGDKVEITVGNNTGYDLGEVFVEIQYLNDAGEVLDFSLEMFDDWYAGSRNRMDFYRTDADFTHAELSFKVSADMYRTDWLPVEYVDNMKIEIIPQNLGEEVDYGYGTYEMGKCIVNDFRYEISFWRDGKASMDYFFSGIKTKDADGPDAKNHCTFRYVVVDENDQVVAYGQPHIESLGVNEEFVDVEGHDTAYLAPGTYKLYIERYYLTF